MTKRGRIGKLGEEIAYRYFTEKHYKIIDKNYRQPWGELDIIAKAPDKTLVFVEVKTLRRAPKNDYFNNNLKPEDNFTKSKLNKTKRAAELYANSNDHLVAEKTGWRIDLVAIDINEEKLSYKLRHWENVL